MRGEGVENKGRRKKFKYMRERGKVELIGVYQESEKEKLMERGDLIKEKGKSMEEMMDEEGERGILRVVMIKKKKVKGEK